MFFLCLLFALIVRIPFAPFFVNPLRIIDLIPKFNLGEFPLYAVKRRTDVRLFLVGKQRCLRTLGLAVENLPPRLLRPKFNVSKIQGDQIIE